MKKREKTFAKILYKAALIVLVAAAFPGCRNPWMEKIINVKTITFNSNGGSRVKSQDLRKGSKIRKPSNPVRSGFLFGGWYEDNNTFESPWDFNTGIRGDMTLYAKWDGDTPPEEPSAHTHQWGDWALTSAATCTEGGVQTRLCALDASHTETQAVPINPDAHAWQAGADALILPTCTTEGYGSQICALCNTTKAEGVIPALGHEFVSYTVTLPAACTTPGTAQANCARDGCEETATQAIAALGHSFGLYELTSPATCSTAGEETRTCARDSAHKEARATTINPEAHDWGEWTQTIDPTEYDDGEKERVCKHNPEHKQTNAIGALGHDHQWGGWEVTTAPTCTVKGEETRFCESNPAHRDYRDVDPTGHDNGAWYTTLAADCTAAGIRELYCTRDNALLNTETIAALGHDNGEWYTTLAAKCTETGKRELYCTRDNALLNTETIAALGHEWGNWVTITAPTATKTGMETRTCTRDANHTEDRTIPATGIKANPTVTWPTAGAITYGAALSTSALSGGSANVPGAFAWTNGAVIPTVTNSGYEVTFTPTDTEDYNTLTQNVTVTVAKAAGAAVSAPSAAAIGVNSVTLAAVSASTGQSVEYARNSSASAPAVGWQADTSFSGLTGGTTYYFFARSASSDNYNAGAASGGTSVTTKQQAGDNTFVTYWVDDTGGINIGAGGQPIDNNTVTIQNGGSVTFSAAGSGYSGHSWTLNGTTVGTGSSYTFDTSANDKETGRNYSIGLTVQKDGKPYYTQITVRVNT